MEGNGQLLQSLRNTLYELLTAVHDDDQEEQKILANQIMGVNMTKAVQRDGVNILQLQNIKAIGKVTNQAVMALKQLDALDGAMLELEHKAPLQLEAPAEESPPVLHETLRTLCGQLLDEDKLNLRDMVHLLRYALAVIASERYPTDLAANRLGIKATYVRALRRAPNKKIEGAFNGQKHL
jgi:hypothetical protein